MSLIAFAGEPSEMHFGNQINSVKEINLMRNPLNNSSMSLDRRQYIKFAPVSTNSTHDDSFH